jgi:hypothetical protein
MNIALERRVAAVDRLRFGAIEELADLASSYWRSVAEAAARGERVAIEIHCRQVAAVTREAFGTVKALGTADEAEAT